MPSIRVGYGSDFVVKDQKVGIGSEDPRALLDVRGTLKGDFNITGVSTLAVYSGFAPQKQNITKDSSIGFSTTGIGTVGITSFISVNERESGFTSLVGEYNTVSEDLIVDEGKIFEISTTNITGITTLGTQEVYAPDDSVVSVGTLESVSIQSHFSFPDGGINDRPDQPVEGMVRFNDDLNTLEFYNGIEWRQFTVSGASGRGVYMNGSNPSLTTYAGLLIDYISIPSLGNAQDFGRSTVSTSYRGTCGSSTRGLTGGGYNSSSPNQELTIDYITIQSTGDSLDFGDLGAFFRNCDAASSSTRGIWFAGGHPSYFNEIEYVEISTLGSSLDFGDQTNSGAIKSATSNSRYAFAHGGFPAYSNSIDKVTISSKGNAITFGNLDGNGLVSVGFLSNETRGVFAGGYYSPGGTRVDTMTYMTLETGGNVSDFGNLTQARNPAGTNTATRGIFAGGYSSGPVTYHNIIDYITIATLGDAQDFGDLVINRSRSRGTSDSHGGLGGF